MLLHGHVMLLLLLDFIVAVEVTPVALPWMSQALVLLLASHGGYALSLLIGGLSVLALVLI